MLDRGQQGDSLVPDSLFSKTRQLSFIFTLSHSRHHTWSH